MPGPSPGMTVERCARRGRKLRAAQGPAFRSKITRRKTKPTMKVVREEIFGPVVCVEPFDDSDLEKIAKKANDTTYGLAASVWTKDISKAHKLAGMIRSG